MRPDVNDPAAFRLERPMGAKVLPLVVRVSASFASAPCGVLRLSSVEVPQRAKFQGFSPRVQVRAAPASPCSLPCGAGAGTRP